MATYRTLVDALLITRDRQRLSLRALAADADLPLSVLTSVENGSTWPRLTTMSAIAEALGLQVVADGETEVVRALREAMVRQHLPTRRVAFRSDLTENTVAGLRHETTTAPSMATILATAHTTGVTVRIQPPGFTSKEGQLGTM